LGQRGGIAYEADVYRQVLQPSGSSAPIFYGSYKDPRTGGVWLFLEYLKKSLRVGKVPRLRAMKLAARWIGEFHAVNEERAAGARFLTAYDASYYKGWPRRSSRMARRLGLQLPWLVTLSKRLESEIAGLTALPQTVIHGEYYPHNILFQSGVVRPVDWETAALARGKSISPRFAKGGRRRRVGCCRRNTSRRAGPAAAFRPDSSGIWNWRESICNCGGSAITTRNGPAI